MSLLPSVSFPGVEPSRRDRLLFLGFVAAISSLTTLAFAWFGFAHGLATALLGGALVQRISPVVRPGETLACPDMAPTCDMVLRVLDDRITATGDRPPVLMIELDGFRRLEESYDRPLLDAALLRTLDRIKETCGSTLLAERLEGPVFIIVLEPEAQVTLEALVQTCQRLQHAIAAPLDLARADLRVTACIGFVLPERAEPMDADGLMKAATAALSEAQRHGPAAVRSYSAALQRRLMERRIIVAEASRALRAGQIIAHFQPQIDLETGLLAGAESLCRWRHPERGMVSPAEFLPALRAAGLMPQLADCMVRHALDALVDWDRQGLVVPRVGVNFSSDELKDSALVSRIAMMLDERGLDPSRLVVEVLETVVAASDEDVTARTLAALSELGCGIDLDDFGTGYAAITNIRRLSIGRIKIDRSFVTRIDHDVDQQDMVSAILTMAHSLGLKTLAEGVESTAEAETLRALGCQFAQGFHFAVPMAPADFADWLRDRAKAPADPLPLPLRRA